MAARIAPPPAVKEALPTLRLEQRLTLFGWMLSLFGAKELPDIAIGLTRPELEEFNAEGVSGFYYILRTRLKEGSGLTPDRLLAYDENIGRHWQAITRRREATTLKYFQYLALLFTEIYLDRYFSDRDGFCASLNTYAVPFNAKVGEADGVGVYTPEGLNKMAVWSATGSGKTLLMHVNLRQYQHYARANARKPVRTILLTPNEDLTDQHLTELHLSEIPAMRFTKATGGILAGQDVEALEFSKLGETMGEKMVAVDAFGDDNLVLIDEGHRGAGGKEEEGWMAMRDRLSANGFSFEYSATFGQAIAAAKKPALSRLYAKCLLFDYSYKYFYGDGYGKDYHILNLPEASDENQQLYLTGGLLTFYQQVRLMQERGSEFTAFRFAAPLWVFVGGSVSAVRTENGRKTSDVLEILRFLAGFVGDPDQAIQRLTRLFTATTPLLDADGRDIFHHRFTSLLQARMTPEVIYADILRRLFHAPAPGRLHVEDLKGQDGEIALRIGLSDPFGLINVGDSGELWKLCREQTYLETSEREFSRSYFSDVNNPRSPIQVLIGSKKFSSGWSSWRVGTMGLMNIGKSEGAEIIQLFGRGVRLQGYGYSLKRSDFVPDVVPPAHIDVLETLNVFGVRADYMKTFQEDLEREMGENKGFEEITIPVEVALPTLPLKTIRVKPGVDFERDGPSPSLTLPDAAMKKTPLSINWYLKVESRTSVGVAPSNDLVSRHTGRLEAGHLAFLDWDKLFFELEEYKLLKGWHGLRVDRSTLRTLLETPDWYILNIPPEELEWTGPAKVRMWQNIALALLKKYLEKFYKYSRSAYELPQMELHPLAVGDPNLLTEYRTQIGKPHTALITQLQTLKAEIIAGTFSTHKIGSLEALHFNNHIYNPLFACDGKDIKIIPAPLNEGEKDFVQHLKVYCNSHPEFFSDKSLYLLRNQSRGKGIGFFDAQNFYPDFLLWLIIEDRQLITFVDPKGIRNLNSATDPKIQFYQTVKELEIRLGDPKVCLNSFIVSNTELNKIPWAVGEVTKQSLNQNHVLFQVEDKDTYVVSLLQTIIADAERTLATNVH